MVCYTSLIALFICHGYLTGIGAITGLPQCQWWKTDIRLFYTMNSLVSLLFVQWMVLLQNKENMSFIITDHVRSHSTNWWLSAKLLYLQCISNGDTTVLHQYKNFCSWNLVFMFSFQYTSGALLYPPNNEVDGGYIGFTPSVCPSLRPSVRLSVCPACRVRSWTFTVLDGFFPYYHKWSLPWEGVSHTMTFDLDLYLQGHSALT